MGLYSHPYAPLLLMLTEMSKDVDMMEALAMEDNAAGEQVIDLITNLEQVCDCSFKD